MGTSRRAYVHVASYNGLRIVSICGILKAGKGKGVTITINLKYSMPWTQVLQTGKIIESERKMKEKGLAKIIRMHRTFCMSWPILQRAYIKRSPLEWNYVNGNAKQEQLKQRLGKAPQLKRPRS
jgi:hypothetical protein